MVYADEIMNDEFLEGNADDIASDTLALCHNALRDHNLVHSMDTEVSSHT
jgi:hypothetical protein